MGNLTIAVILLAAVLVFALWHARVREKAKWNDGKCEYCLKAWEQFGTDSQGGRGYRCACNRTIWVSYKVDA